MQDLSFNSDPQTPDEAFESRVDQALATAPQLRIPPEFAARVAALVPASRPIPTWRFAYARNSIILSGVALLLALLFLAPHAIAGSTYAIALEWILCAELSVLALYVALLGSSLRSAE